MNVISTWLISAGGGVVILALDFLVGLVFVSICMLRHMVIGWVGRYLGLASCMSLFFLTFVVYDNLYMCCIIIVQLDDLICL